MVGVAQSQQTHASERSAGQVERPPRLVERSTLGLIFAMPEWQLGQVGRIE